MAIKPIAKEDINAGSHFYYILQKYYLNKNCMSSESKNKISLVLLRPN